jgi:hypothetical protein
MQRAEYRGAGRLSAIWPSSSRITTCTEQNTEVQAVFRPFGHHPVESQQHAPSSIQRCRPSFESRQEHYIFFPLKLPERFWGPLTLLRVQGMGHAADHSPLVLRLRIAGDVPPFTHCVSWPAQGQIYNIFHSVPLSIDINPYPANVENMVSS